MKNGSPDHLVPPRAAGLRHFARAWLIPLGLLCSSAGLTGAAQTIRVRSSSSNFHPQSLNGNTSVTVSASPSGTAVSLVSKSQAVAGTPITITVTLTNPASTTVDVYGAFGSASAALTSSTSSAAIPSSCIFGLVPTGIPTTYTAFTQSAVIGAAGAGLELMSLSGQTANTTQTATLTLKIDLSSLPGLPAGTYSGTLYLQAQAF